MQEKQENRNAKTKQKSIDFIPNNPMCLLNLLISCQRRKKKKFKVDTLTFACFDSLLLCTKDVRRAGNAVAVHKVHRRGDNQMPR